MPDQIVDPSEWCHDGVAVGELLEDLTNAAWVALQSTYQGAPKECYVSHGTPADDACDFVSVSVLGWYPARLGRFPEVFLGGNRQAKGGIQLQPLLGLHVRRPCQPVPTMNRQNPFPTASALDQNSRSLAADARALTEAWKPAAERIVEAWCGDGTSAVAWEDMRPHQEADCGGWTWLFRVELEDCTGAGWDEIEIPDYEIPTVVSSPLVVPDDADRARAFVAGDAGSADPSEWTHDGQQLAVMFEDLVVAAWQALAHTRLGTPAGVFLNHGELADDDGDLVALSIVGWEPVRYGTGLEPYPGPDRGITTGVMLAPVLELQVRRPCSPGPNANPQQPFPTGDALAATATDLMYDARALAQRWKPVVSALVGAWCGGTGHGSVGWDPIEPVQGGLVSGWNWRFRVEVEPCGDCGPDYVLAPEGGYALPAHDYPRQLVEAHEAAADPHSMYAMVVQAGERQGRSVHVVLAGEPEPDTVPGDVVVRVGALGAVSLEVAD